LNVSDGSYYQNENTYSVYKELRDNIQKVLLKEMGNYIDETNSKKIK